MRPHTSISQLNVPPTEYCPTELPVVVVVRPELLRLPPELFWVTEPV